MTDFAAAYQRVLARRASQTSAESSTQSARSPLHQEPAASRFTRLPAPLKAVALDISHTWDTIRGPYGTQPAFRVGQVDAEILDEELLSLLTGHVGDGLRLIGAHLKDDWSHEISAVLRAVLWKLSIWDHGASYGARLQGLQYIDARNGAANLRTPPTRLQKIAHGLITVGARYAWSRWEEWLSGNDNGYDESSPFVRRLSRLTAAATAGHTFAAFISFCVFLYNGRYRTLTDRLLRLRLVPSSNQTSREVSFEYLNRQLVWHAFTEFLLFMLPLVGISRWRRWVARAWKKAKAALVKLRTGESVAEDDDAPKGELSFLPERTCAICYQDQNPAGGRSEQEVISAGANVGIIGSASTDITNPYETVECGCIYCYVCLAQRIEAEEGEGWTCLRCGEVVKGCRPWIGDVVTQETVSDGQKANQEDEELRPSSRRGIAWADELVQEQKDTVEAETLSEVNPVPIEDETYAEETDEEPS